MTPRERLTQWLVARKRDTEPWELVTFDRYDEAAVYFDAVSAQWSTVYFCRIAHCEGRPLSDVPAYRVEPAADVAARQAHIAHLEQQQARLRKENEHLKREIRRCCLGIWPVPQRELEAQLAREKRAAKGKKR